MLTQREQRQLVGRGYSGQLGWYGRQLAVRAACEGQQAQLQPNCSRQQVISSCCRRRGSGVGALVVPNADWPSRQPGQECRHGCSH
jgi:hypothetical protein